MRTIVQPYSALIFYNTAANSLKNPFLQRYVLFLHTDNYGRIVNYNSPEPVYVIRVRVKDYGGYAVPAVQNEEINEIAKAQEAHFRAWSLQQYQVLKLEIDALNAEGKEPSAEMLLRFIPLEKIAHTVDYSTIAHLPEVKQIRDEHFKIWQNVSINDLRYLLDNKVSAYIDKLEEQLKVFEDKKTKLKERSKFKSIPKSFHRNPGHVISTENDNHDHRNGSVHKHDIKYAHLNKTKVIDDFKQLTLVTGSTTEIPKTNITEKIENENDLTKIPEVLFVARIDSDTETMKTMNPSVSEAEKQEFTTIVNEQMDINSDQMELDQQTTQSFTEVVPEITESQTMILDHFQSISQSKLKNTTKNEIEKFIFNAPQIYVPELEIDTEGVQRAHDEHLSIVSAAIFKAKLAHEENRKEEDDILPDTGTSTTAP